MYFLYHHNYYPLVCCPFCHDFLSDSRFLMTLSTSAVDAIFNFFLHFEFTLLGPTLILAQFSAHPSMWEQ